MCEGCEKASPLPHDEILRWLRETDEVRLEPLWTRADEVRRQHVGEEVHMRGLLEISNHCMRRCAYCGISSASKGLPRYRMSAEEILQCAREVQRLGYGTTVLQAGEDLVLSRDKVAELLRNIKAETGLAITLSLGERSESELKAWKAAGADRYLLRFETSDPELYGRIHPSLEGTVSDRLALLLGMREMGYEIGSGVMVGIPGQTWEILARDLEAFRALDLDMIGVGPFILSPGTPLDGPLGADLRAKAGSEQVPADELTTLKLIALTRILCPEANIPSTTALATLDKDQGRELGLMRGANVVMPNVTPTKYRTLYAIYPGKACIHETALMCRGCMEGRIHSLGRSLGSGAGGRRQGSSLLLSE